MALAGLYSTFCTGVSRRYSLRSFFKHMIKNAQLKCACSYSSFKVSDISIEYCSPDKLKLKPAVKDLVFGYSFTDHMFEVDWKEGKGWGSPRISPFHYLSLHPAAKVLHYSTEVFEGLKGYRGVDGKLRLFRPDLNMARMIRSAERSSLPTFDGDELMKAICRLIQIDQEWVPYSESSSLYIRPSLIGTEDILKVERPREALLFVILAPVGPYFQSGFKPVSLLADPKYVRAWPGGCGDYKMGANYGPTLAIQKVAMSQNLHQVLWLFGEDYRITEVGAMNIFVFLDKGNGVKELATPPLDGLILPGVTRTSLLDIARSWNEFEVSERSITMSELLQAEHEGRLLEMFGAGTAAVVSPVSEVHFKGQVLKIPTMEHKDPVNQKLYRTITDIYYGRVEHKWGVVIE